MACPLARPWYTFGLAAGVIVACAAGASARDCLDYRDYLHLATFVPIDGGGRDIEIAGGRAYVTGDSIGFQVWDVSAPGNPSVLGDADTSGDARVAVAGDYAYLTSAGLEVVDISDPADPRIVGTASLPEAAGGAAVVGDVLYIADGFILQLVDISDPTQPVLWGAAPTFSTTYDVAVVGEYAYVTSNFGMHVVDVSDAANPVLESTHDQITGGRIVVEGNLAYVPGFQGLQVVDLTDAVNPQLERTVSAAGGGNVAIAGSFAYVSSGGGLKVLDLSTPTDSTVSFFIGPGPGRGGLAVAGTYVYVSVDVGMNVIDVSNPVTAPLAAAMSTPQPISDVVVVGSLAYLLEGTSLSVYDVADVSSPAFVGGVDMSGPPTALAVAGGHAFVSEAQGAAGLQAVDISNPAAPMLADAVSIPGQPRDVAALGGYAYVVDGTRLHVVDTSDPANLELVGGVDIPGGAGCVVADGDHAYVAANLAFQVVDVSDAANPLVVGVTEPALSFTDVTVAGGLAYGVGGFGEFAVVDVSTPTLPIALGGFNLDTAGASVVAVAGHYAYVGLNGLEVIDVTDPARPIAVAHVPMPGTFSPGGVSVSGEHVFAANGEAGLQIAWRQCDIIVPVLLSRFQARAAAGGVVVSWQIAGEGASGGFRLSASRGGLDWNVPFAETSAGRFEGVDRSPQLLGGGPVLYRLAHRAPGGGWEELAAELVALPAAARLRLVGVQPNPFNPRATVTFTVDRMRRARLTVLDARGRHVATLADDVFGPGTQSSVWNGTDSAGRSVAAGIYIVQLESEGERHAVRVTLAK